MFKIKNELCPNILQDVFPKIEFRTTRNASFHRPNVNTVFYGENSLRNFGPIVWDTMIPKYMKEIPDIDKFKESIKKWIPVKCPCRLCNW